MSIARNKDSAADLSFLLYGSDGAQVTKYAHNQDQVFFIQLSVLCDHMHRPERVHALLRGNTSFPSREKKKAG